MLHCNVGNTKVGCNTDSQEEVKDRWLHPVCIHHLFQLVIENKLWVPFVCLYMMLFDIFQVATHIIF